MLSGNSTIGDLLAMSREIFDGGASGLSVRLLIDAYSADYTSVVVGAGFVGNTSTETSGNFGGTSGGDQTNDGGSPNIVYMFSGAKFSGDGTSETLEGMASELRKDPNSIVVTVGSEILNSDYLNAAEYASQIHILLSQFPEGKVFLYGYSYGGVVANDVAARLEGLNVSVEYMAIVDGAKGTASNSINRTITGNVKYADNFYQTTPEFLTGSHGAPYTGVNTVNNYRMGYSHSAMDEVTRNAVMIMMRGFMNYNR